MNEVITFKNTDNLLDDVCSIIDGAQRVAYKSVNTVLVLRNWMVGKRIAEEELKGNARASYGMNIVSDLADRLTSAYGKGFTRRTLYKYLQFYKQFPEIVRSLTAQSENALILPSLSAQLLSWSHYEKLLQVEDATAREWYAKEAYEQTWSVSIKLINKGFVSGNNVYGYGYATPQYTTKKGSGYKTIINYISPHDFVPYVAPADWGYVRFGINKIFDDSYSGTAISKYNSYSGTNLYFGTSNYRKELVKAFVKLGGSPTEYTVSKKWPITSDLGGTIEKVYGDEKFSAKDFAQKGIALAMTNNAGEGVKNLLHYSDQSKDALYLTALLGGGEKLIQYG